MSWSVPESKLSEKMLLLMSESDAQILEKCRPQGDDERLFRVFLNSFIAPMFARCSSRIEDLQVLLLVRLLDCVCVASYMPCPEVD